MKYGMRTEIYSLLIMAGAFFAACSTSRNTHTVKKNPTQPRKEVDNFTAKEKHVSNRNSSTKNTTHTYTLSSIGNHPYLGVGLILDQQTNLSRSFTLWEMFEKNQLIIKSDTLYPVLVDYPFNATYAITGSFKVNAGKFNVYKNGKKIKEVNTTSDLNDVYRKIAQAICEKPQDPKKVYSVSEGDEFKFTSNDISNYFPGSLQVKTPSSRIVDTFARFASLKSYPSANPYKDVKDVFGTYSKYNEDHLFFFRNSSVPSDLKESVKPLIFPLAHSISPSLNYLSFGYQFEKKNDWGAAFSCYYSGLNASSKLLVSPYERALIRSILFRQISQLHSNVSNTRTATSALFKLGSDLNTAYVTSAEARKERATYYDGISKIKELCNTAESKAREIRGTKRLGGFLAVISAAGSVASVSPYDNSVSNALMDQAQSTLQEYMNQANSASTLLDQQYQGIDDKIESESFTISDGSQIEIGKPFIASEVYYHLLMHPESAKPIVMAFAADKPKMNNLLQQFYAEQDADAKKRILSELFSHISDMEAKIVNTEVRGYTLQQNTKSSF